MDDKQKRRLTGARTAVRLDRQTLETLRRAHIQALRACDEALGWETEVRRVRRDDKKGRDG